MSKKRKKPNNNKNNKKRTSRNRSLRRTEINVYFDETNHSRKIGISKSKKLLTYEDNSEWYNYMFISFKDEAKARDSILKLEKKYFNSTGEIKGSKLMNFDSFNNMKKNKINFYCSLLDLVKKEKTLFQFGSLNKNFEIIKRIMSYTSNQEPTFTHGISKFVNNNIAFEFYEFIDKEKTIWKILKFIKENINYKIDILKKIPNSNSLINTFKWYILILEELIYECKKSRVIYRLSNVWKYQNLRYSLCLLADELNVNPIVLVDYEEKTRYELNKSFKSYNVKSKEEPLSRVCDYILSLFRRIVRIVNSIHDEKRVISEGFEMKNSYPSEIFKYKENIKELLKKTWNLFDRKIHWETFADIFTDEVATLISYLQLVSENDKPTSEMLNDMVLSIINVKNNV